MVTKYSDVVKFDKTVQDYIKEQMITADIEKFKLGNNEYFIYERLIVLIASLIPSILLLIIALYT